MLRGVFYEPTPIGEVDPAALTAVAEHFPDQDNGTVWFSDGDRSSNPELLGLMMPTVENILERLPTYKLGRKVTAMVVTTDTRTVEPGKTQRGPAWHTDNGSSEAIMISDSLPTEFLVSDKPVFGKLNQMMDLDIPFLANGVYIDGFSDSELEERGFRIFTPNPHEITLFNRHVHRSAKNRTDEPISKTFIRIGVTRSIEKAAQLKRQMFPSDST
jgi:hypothetical protein